MNPIEAWEVQAQQVADQLAPVVPPCPPWCAGEGPHFDLTAVDAADRSATYVHQTHTRIAAVEDTEHGQPFGWRIDQFERVHTDGTVDRWPITVVPQFKGDHGFTSAQCRQIAAAMLNAADELDRLTP